MRSGNPVLNENTFDLEVTGTDRSAGAGMTVGGTVNRSLILLALVVMAAAFSWRVVMGPAGASSADLSAGLPWVIGGGIAGFILALITAFKPVASPITAPLYAVAQGLFLGAISAFYELQFAGPDSGFMQGIVMQAVGLTFGVAFAMFGLYALRIIRVTQKLRAGILAATVGVALFYLVALLLSFFGVGAAQDLLYGSSLLSIGISLVIVAIAAFNLLLDFDLIEQGARAGAPRYMEWYGAFALMVTLIWLYLEILRLLAKLRSQD